MTLIHIVGERAIHPVVLLRFAAEGTE